MNKTRLVIFFAVAFFCIFFASRSIALTKGFEASAFHPATDGGPYFTIYSTEGLGQWQWVIGSTGNYAYRPLQFTQNGTRVKGIIDKTIVQDVHMAVGLVGQWLEFGFDVPVGWLINYTDPNLATATAKNKMAMGDVFLNFKSELVKVKDYKIGFAILPFITIPSGSGKYLNGAGGVTGGGKLLLEFMPVKRWRIALNLGALARQKFTLQNIDETHQALYGLGTSIEILKHVSIAAEVWGRTKLTALFKNKVESPVEADGGMKFAIGDSGVTIDAGGGAGLVRGSGSPTYRAFLGVAYQSPVPERKEAVESEPEPKSEKDPLDDVRKAVVHFQAGKSFVVTPENKETLARVVAALKQVPSSKLTVMGYTDKSGSKAVNWQISLTRAQKVRAYLVKNGIEKTRISVKACDGENPVGDNKTKQGREANRRVEFQID